MAALPAAAGLREGSAMGTLGRLPTGRGEMIAAGGGGGGGGAVAGGCGALAAGGVAGAGCAALVAGEVAGAGGGAVSEACELDGVGVGVGLGEFVEVIGPAAGAEEAEESVGAGAPEGADDSVEV